MSDPEKQFHIEQMVNFDKRMLRERVNLFTKVAVIYMSKVVLCYFLYIFTIEPWLESKAYKVPVLTFSLARFITGIMMHVNMINEIIKGMSKMKFALNHPWLFKHVYWAITMGFAQAAITIIVTLINYAVIATSESIMECVMDFLAVKIIS